MGPPLVIRQVSNLLVVHFIGRLSLETKPRLKSSPTFYRSSDVGFSVAVKSEHSYDLVRILHQRHSTIDITEMTRSKRQLITRVPTTTNSNTDETEYTEKKCKQLTYSEIEWTRWHNIYA